MSNCQVCGETGRRRLFRRWLFKNLFKCPICKRYTCHPCISDMRLAGMLTKCLYCRDGALEPVLRATDRRISVPAVEDKDRYIPALNYTYEQEQKAWNCEHVSEQGYARPMRRLDKRGDYSILSRRGLTRSLGHEISKGMSDYLGKIEDEGDPFKERRSLRKPKKGDMEYD